ncbi:MAG: dihydrolipoamide acetyltransferase family protein [Thermoleophilaceae bacterium]
MGEVAFHLADTGEGLTEAEVVEWKVAVGDPVEEHQPVVEVETDKARIELPAPATGTLASIGADVGEVVEVGAVLFTVAVDGDVPAASDGAPVAEPAAPEPTPAAPRKVAGDALGAAPRRVLAAPATRRLAVELGIDLASVDGSGPGGRIVEGDVRQAVDGPPSAPAANRGGATAPQRGTPEPLRGIRRAMARSMTAAWAIPHITELRDVDATGLVRLQRALRHRAGEEGIRTGFAPLLVKVAAAALEAHPALNATFDAEQELLTVHGSVNVGVAIDAPDGLMVPVIADAASRSLLDLAREIQALGDAARERKLTPSQLTGGSFTVTNTGAYGGQFGTPMIRSPEVAIAGFGRTRDAVVAVDGEPAVRPMLPLSVSVDHRVVSGAELGNFITTVEELVGDPSLLALGSS